MVVSRADHAPLHICIPGCIKADNDSLFFRSIVYEHEGRKIDMDQALIFGLSVKNTT